MSTAKFLRCVRCCCRYEAPSERTDFACPHCSDPHVGIGAGFDAACVDATARLRRLGLNRAWIVASHLVYTRDIADGSVIDDRLVHMVRLTEERYDHA